MLEDFILLGIAGLNALTAFLTWRTHKVTQETNVVTKATNILTQQVETATNSMKDALVSAEKKISFSEGREQGIENHIETLKG